MKTYAFPLILCASALAACGGDELPEKDRPAAPSGSTPAPAGHGSATDLGAVTVAGKEFGIFRLGDLVPGEEGAFEVHPKGAAAVELATLNVYLWVESRDGTQLSAAAKGSVEDGALHFHVTPRAGEKEPFRAVLRLRAEGVDERASLPLDGHGHEHHDGPHGGVPAAFTGGETAGRLELKLHDDQGDLELWLYADEVFQRPFDLPLEASVEVELVDAGGRKITMRPRDRTRNEDEDGNPNVRDGKTSYFVFPTQAGEDASWLRGKEFSSVAIVRFTRGAESFVSEELLLKPHVH